MTERYEQELMPVEMVAAVGRRSARLTIGLPYETVLDERRVALTPEGVQQLVAQGHTILVESGAGEGAGLSDMTFSEAGAQIVYSKEEVFKSDIILQVAPPSKREVQLLREGQVFISPLQLSTLEREVIATMIARRATCIALEFLQDRQGSYPVVHAMSEIAGVAAVLIAGELLSNVSGKKGILLGGVTGVVPARMVIIGAGAVGTSAARLALALGVQLQVFDFSLDRLWRLQMAVGERVYTSTIYPEALRRAVADADVVIGALRPRQGRVPLVVTEDMVRGMKPYSVIIDVSIDQGGCIETSRPTTHDNPTFVVYDVIHYCVPNIPSRFARTASAAISNVLTPMLVEMAECGGLDRYMWVYPHARNGVYLYRGIVTNQAVAERFSYRYTDITLLISTALR